MSHVSLCAMVTQMALVKLNGPYKTKSHESRKGTDREDRRLMEKEGRLTRMCWKYQKCTGHISEIVKEPTNYNKSNPEALEEGRKCHRNLSGPDTALLNSQNKKQDFGQNVHVHT